MRNLDTDGSGNIDYTEFMAATLTKKQYLRREAERADDGTCQRPRVALGSVPALAFIGHLDQEAEETRLVPNPKPCQSANRLRGRG